MNERVAAGASYREMLGEQAETNGWALLDVWDALRSDRPYRKHWSDEKTMAYIKKESGVHFDPRIVEEFERHVH